MNNRNLGILLGALAALVLTACTTPPPRELSHELAPNVSLPSGHNPLNPEQLVPQSMPADVDVVEGVIPYFERVRGHSLNILELSGGGQNGAFGAGFLNGWRESGTRPQFDIVTGVSTGSLLATHAFLGTAVDDATLSLRWHFHRWKLPAISSATGECGKTWSLWGLRGPRNQSHHYTGRAMSFLSTTGKEMRRRMQSLRISRKFPERPLA